MRALVVDNEKHAREELAFLLGAVLTWMFHSSLAVILLIGTGMGLALKRIGYPAGFAVAGGVGESGEGVVAVAVEHDAPGAAG